MFFVFVILMNSVRLSTSRFISKPDMLEVVNNVDFNQYAHAVFLHFPDNPEFKRAYCGGSLLLAQVVISSADCLKEITVHERRIVAYLGSSVPNKAKAIRQVVDVKVHPQYDDDELFYNVGLAFLNEPPPLNDFIRKIILPVWNLEKENMRNLAEDVSEVDKIIMEENLVNNNVDSVESGHVSMAYSEMVLRRNNPEPVAYNNLQAFMAVYTFHSRSDSPSSVLSSMLAGYKVELLRSEDCYEILLNISHPEDTICTRSNFVGQIDQSPGSGLLIKSEIGVQLIGVYSRFLDGLSVFTNVDRHREWIKDASHTLYKRTCFIGHLYCNPNSDGITTNCTVDRK